ncbi:MAG: T9SS type A sorting domain-containing protein [Flavobacteriales bacterium]|nr:T9SS type A sorting domain-containing protein [Flavobacteriales bacterium]
MSRFLTALMFQLSILVVVAQPPIEWQRNLGGSLDDSGASIEQTSDGGYILCGTTNSNNVDVTGNHGNSDIWVVKLNGNGDIQWQRCLGGSQPDFGRSARQLGDGSYLVLGSTRSNDGDVSGNHGGVDFWLVRLDSDGDPIWQRCYGGSLNDAPFALEATPDGGYVLAGESRSTDGDVTANAGFTDYWVLKLDAAFDIQWQHSYGGSGGETAYTITLASDGGYFLNGFTDSQDGDVIGSIGTGDFWVLKIDINGEIEWQRPCGGSNIDYGFDVKEMSDGSIIALGESGSNDGDVIGAHGGDDYLVVKLTSSGAFISSLVYGGSNTDRGRAIFAMSNTGFLLIGASSSSDNDVEQNSGSFDGWVVRTDPNGAILWQLSLGGSQSDGFGGCAMPTSNGFLLWGGANSSDVNPPNNFGGSDIWLVKLGADPVGVIENLSGLSFSLFPNPNEGQLHITSPCTEGTQAHWTISNVNGQRVDSGTIIRSEMDLSVEQLAPGSYVLTVDCGAERSSVPFIKK